MSRRATLCVSRPASIDEDFLHAAVAGACRGLRGGVRVTEVHVEKTGVVTVVGSWSWSAGQSAFKALDLGPEMRVTEVHDHSDDEEG